MRFSLRSLLMALLIFSVVVILAGRNYQRVQSERAAIESLEKVGAIVASDKAPGWLVACVRSPYQATSVTFTGAPTFIATGADVHGIVDMAAQCPGLDALTIWGEDVAEADVLKLRKLSRLQFVDLSNCRLDARATAALFQLEVSSLRLTGSKLTIKPEAVAKANRTVVHLNLVDTLVEDANVQTLANYFPAVRTLLLRGTSVTDRSIHHLGRFDELQVLDLGRTGISGRGLASAVGMAKLEVLLLPDVADNAEPPDHFGRAVIYDRREIEPEAVVFDVNLDDLASLPALRKIDLSGRTIRAPESRLFWRRLEWLSLSGSSVDDAFLINFGDAPHLRELGMADTAVTDAGLAKLTTLFPSLRSLDLRGTKISLDGLRTLAELPDLEEVFVSADRLKCSVESLRAAFKATRVVRVYVNDNVMGAVECDEQLSKGELSILPDWYPLVRNYPVYSE